MSSFAYYRFPHASAYHSLTIEGEPEELLSVESLNGRSGFVFAPFVVSEQCPILLFSPSSSNQSLPSVRLGGGGSSIHLSPSREREVGSYHETFAHFHEALCAGRFTKLVLARVEDVETGGELPPLSLFEEACRCYPRMFVALVSAPRCGTWLMATPEVLLRNNPYRTMALAGTMKLEGSLLDFDNPSQDMVQQIRWSQKNIQEQRYVASYIKDCLKTLAADIIEKGPYTTRAANLVHLRSDFEFALKDDSRLGTLLAALHPTPAVCGLPKEEARQFILVHEGFSRRYYSGFCGPLCLPSETEESLTALYVSLRCMEIGERSCRLYAGGGILPDSIAQQEWEETEAKMQTMKRLLEGMKDEG